MIIKNIAELIEGRFVTGKDEMNTAMEFAMASDLMSDVLTLDTEHTFLITGLANMQTIRTAEMSDIHCIVFARNKKATFEMINLAEQNNLVIIESSYAMFRICGILFQAGIKALY